MKSFPLKHTTILVVACTALVFFGSSADVATAARIRGASSSSSRSSSGSNDQQHEQERDFGSSSSSSSASAANRKVSSSYSSVRRLLQENPKANFRESATVSSSPSPIPTKGENYDPSRVQQDTRSSSPSPVPTKGESYDPSQVKIPKVKADKVKPNLANKVKESRESRSFEFPAARSRAGAGKKAGRKGYLQPKPRVAGDAIKESKKLTKARRQ